MDDIKICTKCEAKITGENHYQGKYYCSRCYSKAVEYESDSLRKKYDIRNRDPKTLSSYQEAQLNVIKGMQSNE